MSSPGGQAGCSLLLPGQAPAGKVRAGQVNIHLAALPLPVAPVNTSLSDGKVNKFSSRLKVSIISFVNDK